MLRLFFCGVLLSFTFSVPAGAAKPDEPVILVLGDSLSAGYGLDAEQGWVHLFQQKLRSEGFNHVVANAAISGETTRGGLGRLPGLLDRHKPTLVLLQLGGNDGLRALPVKAMRQNLQDMIALSQKSGAEPVLFAMHIPANYGPTYSEQFSQSFEQLADAEKLTLVPFVLGSFAFDEDAFQSDGIHPNAASQALILETVWPAIVPLLKAVP